jgi:hypothetical protein
MFYEESYNAFPTLLNFIRKLNSNQRNIKKKFDENNFEKKYYKKRKHKRNWKKKTCEEKLYQSIVFCEEKLVFNCNCNS